VLEAMATGLPVLFKDSGGTRELVGGGGVAVDEASFRPQLDAVLANGAKMSGQARSRAEQYFAMDVILARYLRAIKGSQRQALPTPIQFLWAIARGYPVLPFSRRELPKRFWWRLRGGTGGRYR